MRRTIFDSDHEQFRQTVMAALERDIAPRVEAFERQGHIDRDVFVQLGELGIIGIQVPEHFGGGGQRSFKFNAVIFEASAHTRIPLGALQVHMNVVMPYFLKYSTPAQQQRWFPGLASGETLTAIAMTEPGAGSDLAGIAAAATPRGDGGYLLSGSKTFITGGYNADLVVVVARTSAEENRRSGMSLLVVEEGMTGFARGRKLSKLGLGTQDTVELFFDEVYIPPDNVLGETGAAFTLLASNLPQERLSIALSAVAMSEAALTETIAYTKGRNVFGKPLSTFQNSKFELADMGASVTAARVLVDHALEALDAGALTPADAARVKLFTTELQGRVVDRCLQLHGGYGYMREQPITRMYADARVSRIYGGSSEVMKLIISKDMGL
ncbi:acyl-CoA dehydrogenase family protein [Mycolicibacterium sphagni]|uniref:Acyl-CoA dehydrogenase n=1 Tax=Mycolicibacterium sphagni TaxID=1786 RepID=A0A255D9R8_9MYCO|nr:acyl-CoA dehydrogenase family protein [Mycolicibacterium sphagni]OYN76167.1 acyl-CoA dehydrogenase [Mycolicibacterium sphagni]